MYVTANPHYLNCIISFVWKSGDFHLNKGAIMAVINCIFGYF